MINVIGLVLLFYIVIACTNNGSKESGKIQHPVEEYMPSHNMIKQAAGQEVNIDGISDPVLKKFLAKINNISEPKYTVGASSDSAGVMFGNINDVETYRDNVFILDSRAPAITKVDVSGNVISKYGQKGKGPTDLFNPVDLEISNNGKIYVADKFNEVKVLRSTDEGIEHEESFLTTGVEALDMCVMNGNMYIRSISKNQTKNDSTAYNLVHVYSLDDFEYVRGFGEMYQSPHPGTNRMLSGDNYAHIVCNEATNTVAYSYNEFSYIYGYSEKGDLKWITELNPFEGAKVEETVSGGESVGMFFENGGDLIYDIKPFIGEYFFVRVLSSGVGERNFILSSKTGQAFNFGYSQLPNIIKVDKDNFYITAWDDNKLILKAYAR